MQVRPFWILRIIHHSVDPISGTPSLQVAVVVHGTNGIQTRTSGIDNLGSYSIPTYVYIPVCVLSARVQVYLQTIHKSSLVDGLRKKSPELRRKLNVSLTHVAASSKVGYIDRNHFSNQLSSLIVYYVKRTIELFSRTIYKHPI